MRTALAVLCGAVPFGVVFACFCGDSAGILGVVVGGVLVGMPIDRLMDDKYRPLHKT